MKNLRRLLLPTVCLPAIALAVYAPIPEQEQGKALTFRLGASTYYDSNIFGGATGKIDSLVYNLSGAVAYNGSVDDQTFASASYELSNDHVADRPGKKNLTSHNLSGRLAHSFAADTNIDVSAAYNISKNPQSLLSGQPLNADQSFKRAQLDARYTTAAGQKTGLVAKYRLINYAYDTATLATDLDRSENLLGLEVSYALLPQTKLVGEYRYQAIGYDKASSLKDKNSHFLMTGFDYSAAKKLTVSGRAGFEDRSRDSAPSTTSPYVELSSRYSYAERSFLAAGYTYTIEEPSDVTNYTDSNVSRIFVNLQHQVSGAISVAGSVTYDTATLQGRGGVHADVDEQTTRLGLAINWQPTKNWTVTGSYDLDDVSSDDAARGQNRDRIGVAARYTF